MTNIRNHEREAVMRKMHQDGKSLAQIGEPFGISRQRVKQIFDRMGVAADQGGVAVRAREQQSTQ